MHTDERLGRATARSTSKPVQRYEVMTVMKYRRLLRAARKAPGR